MACNVRRYALIFIALVASLPVQAADVSSLYTAEAELRRDDAESRNAAYTDGLSQVLSRLTGLADPIASPEIAALFPDPARYVLQYWPGDDATLWISFDGPAIERALRAADVTVWGDDRPLTLVWLAVDWGGGEREIVAAGDAERSPDEQRSIDRNRLLRERVQEAALQRGLPIAFPLLDVEDLDRVSFSDIWGGFDDRLREASRRYEASSILVGRIRPYAGGSNRWSWYFGGEQREWTGEPEDVVARLAGSLASRFAIAGNAEVDTFVLTISGIDSVAAFGAVQSFMEQLDIVDTLAIDTVRGDRIRYRVSCRGGGERLRRVLEVSGMLEPVQNAVQGSAGTVAGPGALRFRYRP
ncbi:MAG TPA: DUF2066 domain-containing protein [Woeseiaceae bacterium]|nr:DUF2066 domain-containing protein [Woeseiaceae bacterium]